MLFLRAALWYDNEAVKADAWENVAFGAVGGATLVGDNPMSSDAGIASIVVQTEPGRPGAVYALTVVRGDDGARIFASSLALSGEGTPPFELRYTTDGSEPGPDSLPYSDGAVLRITDAPVRAAVVAHGRVVAQLDERAPKTRIRGSAPPETREPFRHG